MFLLLLLLLGLLLEFGPLGRCLLPPLPPELQLGLAQGFPLPGGHLQGRGERSLRRRDIERLLIGKIFFTLSSFLLLLIVVVVVLQL